MKNSSLRTSLIKSAILLVVISLIIYLTISSPEGSVLGAIGAIIYTIFKAIQLVIGLVLALLVCFAVLVGIFFGGVAMLSTESAGKMYSQLRKVIKDAYDSFRSCLPVVGKKEKSGISDSEDFVAQVNKSLFRLEQAVAEMKDAQLLLEGNMQSLQDRVERSEEDESITRLSDWLRAEEEKTVSLRENFAMLDEQMRQVKEQVRSIEKTLETLSSTGSSKDITERFTILDERSRDMLVDLGALRKKIDSQERELTVVRQQLQDSGETEKGAAADQLNLDEHRIFSYIENHADKEKIIQLATEAVQQDMTYAQATEYITDNISKKSGEIIAEHPSLTQDFIREIRKRN